MSEVFGGVVVVLIGVFCFWYAFTSKELYAPFGPAEPARRLPIWLGRIVATLLGIQAVFIGIAAIGQGLKALK